MSIRWKLLFAIATIGIVYGTADPLAVKKFSDWSPPILVPNVNSAFGDFTPAISRDGRSLYFASNRTGNNDLWVSQRRHVKDPWGAPVTLGPTVNTNAIEAAPAFSRDGHWMFFNSDRENVSGSFDIWVSYRQDTRDDFGWTTPMKLGPNINSSFFDAGPSHFANRSQDDDDDGSDENGDDVEDGVALLFFNSTRPPGSATNYDLYVSQQHADGSFGLPTFLSELNSPCTDQRPSIRSDGLEIFFFSNRSVSGGGACATNNDLWVAKRDTLSQVWYTPENLGPVVNGEFNDLQPSISSDGRTLYFTSTRPGGPGLLDLYATTRDKSKP